MDQQQPGQVIFPKTNDDSAAKPEHLAQAERNSAIPAQPSPIQSAASVPVETPAQSFAEQPQSDPRPVEVIEQASIASASPKASQNLYSSSDNRGVPEVDLAWVSNEYVHSPKSISWYMVYMFAIFLISALVWFVTKDAISSIVVLAASLGLIYVIARKPREQTYALHDGNLAIGRKWYALKDFKAFAVDQSTQQFSVILMPLKRFLPTIEAFVDREHQEVVTAYLAQFLPLEPHRADAVDNLLRKVRF